MIHRPTGHDLTASQPAGPAFVPWLAGTAVVAMVTLVLALLLGGGAPSPPPPGIPDAGPVTGWGVPLLRLLTDIAGVATVGAALLAAYLLPGEPVSDATVRGPRRAVVVLALVSASLAAAQTLWLVSELQADPLPTALDPAVVASFVTETTPGRALLSQIWLWMATACAVGFMWDRTATTSGMALALAALLPAALGGHATTGDLRSLAVASLAVHVVAVATWVGGLGGVAWVARRGLEVLEEALPRFSRVALVCFVIVTASGVVNAVVRVESWGNMFGTSYGILVLAKVTALVVLGGFGLVQRRRIIARIRANLDGVTPSRAGTTFASVAALELTVMAATIALGVGLSRTPTP